MFIVIHTVSYTVSYIVIFILALTGCSMLKMNVTPTIPIIPEPIVVEKRYEGTLWNGATKTNMLFMDNKAKKVNDIVTIVVSESSTAVKKATTKTSNSSDISFGISSLFGMQNSNPNILTSGALSGGTDNEFDGSGTTTRSGELKGNITAMVINVLPNGNLLIEGRRSVKVNNEDQIMTITGIIRPEDISFDNTIKSTYIADAKITYEGSGVISDKQRPGWALRLLDAIWPF